MINVKKPLRTKDNRVAKIISSEGMIEYPFVGYIQGSSKPMAWNTDGELQTGVDHSMNIENIKEKRTAYINIFKTGGGNVYKSLEQANKNSKGRLHLITVDYDIPE